MFHVDVIIPTYNRSALLLRALESVLQQTYQDYHVYIVDDGSTDNTQEVLEKYHSHPKVTILFQENKGVSAARNYGIKNSSSEWIALLDSDDEWLPEKLQLQVDGLLHQDLRFSHTEEVWIRNGVRVNPKLKHNKGSVQLFERSLEFCLISPSTTMMRRDLFNHYGPFNENYPVCEDYDLWNKILAFEEVSFLATPLTKKYGGHEDQLSTRYIAMDYWRLKSLAELYSHPELHYEKKEKVREEIIKKGEFLKRGYQKHNHQDLYLEVHELLLNTLK